MRFLITVVCVFQLLSPFLALRLFHKGSPPIAAVSVIVAAACYLAEPINASINSEKARNLSNDEIASIVRKDIVSRQALATADFTREIYDEECTFQDEIDTYKINDYVKGTKALFNAGKSQVKLFGDVIADSKQVQFAFEEKLTFNLPLSPYVPLTGKVILTRGNDGLIVKSREYWDEPVPVVLSHLKF